jgi:hypothetical protein
MVVALLAVILAAVLIWVEHRNRALADQLIAEVARVSGERARPVHRAPGRDGSFQECLGPLLDAQPHAGYFDFKHSSDINSAMKALEAGSTIDSAVLADAERLERWARDAASCTHAARVGDAPGLGPFAEWGSIRNDRMGLARFMVPGSLLMRSDSLEPTAALQDCADVIAFARDGVLDNGLIGAMVANQTIRRAAAPCGRALARADPESRTRFRDELAVLRQSMPPFRDVLYTERAVMQVMAFGQHLDERELALMTPNARAMAANTQFRRASGFKSLVSRMYWIEYAAEMDRLIAASGTPDEDRVFLERDQGSLLLKVLGDGSTSSSMVRFSSRYAAALRGVSLIESAARISVGESPLPGVDRSASDDTLSVLWDEDVVLSITVSAAPAK